MFNIFKILLRHVLFNNLGKGPEKGPLSFVVLLVFYLKLFSWLLKPVN